MIYFQRKEINMSGLLSMIGMQTELDYLIGDFPACFGDAPLAIPKGNIPSDNQKCQSKAQHEFTIKGIKVMAASKKNAIKKYNHHKNINGTYSPVLPFLTNEMAFNDFIYNVKYFTGNKYLVTGDLLDETGTDGEPLIKNVKILKKL